MNIDEINILPNKVTSQDNIGKEFRSIFNTDEARKIKSIVYFFLAEKPVARMKGESRILYIGKTDQTIHKRWSANASKLNSPKNALFYKYVLANYGAISVGYLEVDNPRESEKKIFKEFYNNHLEFPPKSSVG